MNVKIPKSGYLLPSDPRIEGIKYGNWGSRPYEYFWASSVENIEGKDILDIGTAQPSSHNWNQFVKSVLKPKSYLGIDHGEDLRHDYIDEENHKVIYMDASNLLLDDDSIDVSYSISTFEHIPDIIIFKKIIKEIHRVLRPGGKLIVTMDEIWDKDITHANSQWNDLEKAFKTNNRLSDESFCMVDFSNEISENFKPITQPIRRLNKDASILHSSEWNVCVSYCVFEVVK